MKVKDFVAAIGVTSTGYHRFMTQHGKEKGMQSNRYIQAWKFFEKRKAAGLKMPTKKKAKTDGDATKSPASAKKGAKKDEGIPDLSDIHLDGEDTDAVEVYDTCDEVRRKISAFLRKPGVTQAAFCRALFEQVHAGRKPAGIRPNSLLHSAERKVPLRAPRSSCTTAHMCSSKSYACKRASRRVSMGRRYGGPKAAWIWSTILLRMGQSYFPFPLCLCALSSCSFINLVSSSIYLRVPPDSELWKAVGKQFIPVDANRASFELKSHDVEIIVGFGHGKQ